MVAACYPSLRQWVPAVNNAWQPEKVKGGEKGEEKENHTADLNESRRPSRSSPGQRWPLPVSPRSRQTGKGGGKKTSSAVGWTLSFWFRCVALGKCAAYEAEKKEGGGGRGRKKKDSVLDPRRKHARPLHPKIRSSDPSTWKPWQGPTSAQASGGGGRGKKKGEKVVFSRRHSIGSMERVVVLSPSRPTVPRRIAVAEG